MSTPFKMKGMSFGNSPMKQDKMGLQKTPGKEVKEKKTKKFRLSKQTDAKTGKTTYSKISGGSSTDGGKTFTPTVNTKISEAEYNSMKGQ
tara:strand:+ start:27 stop:296 length:270 start_codon:yes stop_codon:yes gene_type:complete